MSKIKKHNKTHAITMQESLEKKFNFQLEEIKREGFTIVENLISEDTLAEMRTRIDKIYETQVHEIGGEQNLDLLGDMGFAMSLLSYDSFFLQFVVEKKYTTFAKHFIGNHFQLFCQNGVINQPDRTNAQIVNKWHRDFNYLHFTTSQPFGLNIFYIVDDFTEDNGGTIMLPGSHKYSSFPSIKYAEEHKVQIIANAGSAIIFDPMVFHRSGSNNSNKKRRVMTNIFTHPFMKQQLYLPQHLKDLVGKSEEKLRILGFGSETAMSSLEFRNLRLRKINS